MLRHLPPFNKYELPRPSEIEFVVVDDFALYGQYTPEPHCITISTARQSHLQTFERTMAHEMVHMILYLQGKRYELHNKNFYKLIYQIAEIYGWEPKDL
jgi:Zn-dependent peptidase ImmA (M78 family)